MKKTYYPLCLYCGRPISDEPITRNMKFHKNCAYTIKKNRSKEEYENRRDALLEEKRHDLILEALYNQYGPDAILPVELLKNANVNFGLTKFHTIVDGLRVNGIDNYGYILFVNDSFKLIKFK